MIAIAQPATIADPRPDTPLRIAVVVGSVRENRFGPVVARWFAEHAAHRPDLDVEVLDLADVNVALSRTFAGHDVSDSERNALAGLTSAIERADGFVVVTPEFNHGYPAALKEAIDVHREQWYAKPVAFVSYGGLSGGLRSVEGLRLVFAELHAMTVRDTVSFHGAWQQFGEDGTPVDPEATSAADAMLDGLTWWADTLRTARDDHRYATIGPGAR